MPPVEHDPFQHPIEVPSSNGVTLAAYDLGGDGPDMLMVHANGFCAGVWAPLAARLGEHRRVAVDLRGHGLSGLPSPGGADALRWEGTADDVLATIDALGLVRPVGIGHSMGGAALVLAEERRPGTFSCLWLYEPVIFPSDGEMPARMPSGDPLTDNPLAQGARRRRTDFASAEEALANFSSKPPLDELDPESLEAYVRYGFDERPDGSVTLRCRPEVEAKNFEMGAHHGAWGGLDRVRCPAAVLRGRTEGFGPAVFADRVADKLVSGRLEEHPELGHFGPLAALDSMARSIRALVSGAA